MSGESLACAAEALVGRPFRLHGRDPATGLDCIGVLDQALQAIGRQATLPQAYSLRTRQVPDLSGLAESCGFAAAEGVPAPGDVLFVRIGPVQFHLVIAARDGRFVHAHAGLRRVVTGRIDATWPIIGHWRLGAAFQG